MAQLITLTILGACIAAAVVLLVVMLVIALLGPPAPRVPTRTPLGRLVGAVTAAMLVSAMAVVTFPAVLDPLCDDFDWFGAQTATTARRYAYVIKAPIGRIERR